MSNNFQCVEQNHSYFYQTPNLIDDLGLDPYTHRVYCALKRITGDHHACTMSIKNLADRCQMSVRKVQESKKILSSIFPSLGKPLIKIHHRFSESGDPDTDLIIIVDVWPENMAHYSRQNELKNSLGVVHNMHQGGAPGAPKEEPFKEEPSKETKNDKSKEKESSSFRFSSFSKEKKEEKEPKGYQEIENLFKSHQIDLNSEDDLNHYPKKIDVYTWLKHHSLPNLISTITYALQMKPKSLAKYIQKLLSSKYYVKLTSIENNKALASNVIKEGSSHLKMLKSCVEDNYLKDSYSYSLDEAIFKQLLIRSIERAQNRSKDEDYTMEDMENMLKEHLTSSHP